MGLPELFLIALGLSMDAFAVAVCTGFWIEAVTARKALTVGLYFGVFQAGMPLLGYLAGSRFAERIAMLDHWIAFGLLVLIGGKMIKESFGKEECKPEEEPALTPGKMLPLALATSIDALAVGFSFALLRVDIVRAVTLIGAVTLILSTVGVKLGNLFGGRHKAKAEFAGGTILILIGTRILIEHLGS